MNIGILGAGKMTRALGRRFIEKGHRLLVSYSRNRDALEKAGRELGAGTQIGSAVGAARFGDVLLLATGWDGAAPALKAAGALNAKLLWSIVTPLNPERAG